MIQPFFKQNSDFLKSADFLDRHDFLNKARVGKILIFMNKHVIGYWEGGFRPPAQAAFGDLPSNLFYILWKLFHAVGVKLRSNLVEPIRLIVCIFTEDCICTKIGQLKRY